MANSKNQDFSQSTPMFPMFDTTDIYGKDRMLRKAVDSGLIIEVPIKEGRKKNSYFFLNSDIVFNINSSGIEIIENKKVYPKLFRHCTLSPKRNRQTVLNEIIAFRRPGIGNPSDEFYHIRHSLREIFTPLWWMIRHQSLISDTINVYRSRIKHPISRKLIKIDDLPEKWRHQYRYLYKRAIGEVFMTPLRSNESLLLHPYFYFFVAHKVSLSFVPSYSIFKCFSNFEEHIRTVTGYKYGNDVKKQAYKKTPMDFLKILTSEKYEIIPQKRQRIFTSILGYENTDEKSIYVPNDLTEEQKQHSSKLIKTKIKSEKTCWIDRNTTLASDVFSSILLPKWKIRWREYTF